MIQDNRLNQTDTTSEQSHKYTFQYEQKADAEKLDASRYTSGSPSQAASEDGDGNGRTVVSFGHDDKSNPYNWPQSKKLYVVITGM
jgi:hypothetical protein